jgi:transketolase
MLDHTTKAKHIRQEIIKMLAEKETDVAGNLSIADVLTALYFGWMKHNPREPKWPERDRIFVTKELAPAWNAALAHSGYFPRAKLQKELTPGHQNPVGIAIGSALAAQIDGKKHQVYCIINDAEHNEAWEAIQFAGNHKLSNLTLIVNRKSHQELEPLRAKYEAFNWNVIEIDGHNIKHIFEALSEIRGLTTRPTAIIAHTIPGKGVSFIENNQTKTITKKESEQALKEL